MAAGNAATCPMDALGQDSVGLGGNDLLMLSMHKRMVVQRATDESGHPELRLYYGPKEISFDEPELFAFGEALAKQSQFRAAAATSWGDGYDWTTVKGLLEHLLQEGVLERATDDTASDMLPASMVRPSPLPAATCTEPKTWADCEAITRELTGQPVEVGYLELIVPVFRVAHIAMDADGRQVGEANVFPRALRLDAPTTWLACSYSGTRYMVERPMNVTALKAMRLHWRQMMAALLRIRGAFLRRFRDAAEGWTVGRLERLATLVLSVPTYQVVRTDRPVANGQLHPALSSLFRVTDGLRTTMHQMLFVPIGEPTLSPDAPLTSAQIFDYAERNYSFFSETGVCGGPRHMVEEFLSVLVDGHGPDGLDTFVFDAPVEAALADIEAAFDYGLLGLQAHAAIFSLWPGMSRTYERLSDVADAAVADGLDSMAGFRDRMAFRVKGMKAGTYLATEEWRVQREQVYADMYAQCGRGLSSPRRTASLIDQIAPVRSGAHAAAESALADMLARRFGAPDAAARHLDALKDCLMDFFVQAQAIFRSACATQHHINRLLGRALPTRPFGAAEVNVHNRLLQGNDSRRLPYLVDELEDALGIGASVDIHHIAFVDRHAEVAVSN